MSISRSFKIYDTNKFPKSDDFHKISESRTFIQSCFLTDNESLKSKLNEFNKFLNIRTNDDLLGMESKTIDKFEKKTEKLFKEISLLATNINSIKNLNSAERKNFEKKMSLTFQKAERNLQSFVKKTETQVLPTDCKWTKDVIEARFGKKIPKGIIKNLPMICQKRFLKKLQYLDVPLDKRNQLQQKIDDFSGLLLETAKIIQNDKNYDPRMKIICMDVLIDDLALAIENEFTTKTSHQDVKPRIVQTQKGEYVLEKEAVIENLCLRGGGGKGFGYAGMLTALTKAGKLDHLKEISGSSAGAIAAVAVGFGTPPEKLGEFSDKIQSGASRKKSKETLKNYPALKDMFSGVGLMGSAAGVIEAIDRETTSNVQKFLKGSAVQNFLNSQMEKINQGEKSDLSKRELERLQNLQNVIIPDDKNIRFERQEESMITFNDIEILKKIQGEGIKNNFKSIILTGWDKTVTPKKEVYFCAKNSDGIENNVPTPDMPIAYGVRISMGLPGAFKEVNMNLTKYQPGGIQIESPHKYMDGGLGSNSPNEAFIKPLSNTSSEKERIQHQDAQQKTLTCLFDEGGDGFRMNSGKFEYVENWLIKIFLFLLDAIKSRSDINALREEENKKLDNTGNTIIVGHGELGTLSLSPTEEERNAAVVMANLMAVDWLRVNGEEQDVRIESSSLDALLEHLSDEELQQVDASDWDIFKKIEKEINRREELKQV